MSKKTQLYVKYCIYPTSWDISTPYRTCSKIWTSKILLPDIVSKIAEWVANSVDPDETPHSAASHLGLQFAQACLSEYIW